MAVLEKGRLGETYLLGGRAVRNNLAVVKALCAAFDRLRPEHAPHDRLITFVADRPGHDRRYAIDPSKAEAELGWQPTKDFEQALEETVRWYLDNEAWWRPIREGRYTGERLGLGTAPDRAAPEPMPEPMDILILGGAGQVGTELQAPALWEAGVRLHAPSRAALDITDAAAIDAALARAPTRR